MMNEYPLYLPLGFGKYKDLKLDEIIKLDLPYVEWCILNIKDFCISRKDVWRIIKKYPGIRPNQDAVKELFLKIILDEYTANEAIDDEISYISQMRDEDHIRFYQGYNDSFGE